MAAGAPRYEPYRDIAPSPFRWRLGVRPLDLDDWIELDGDYEADIARKRRLLDEHFDTVFADLDGTEDAGQEVLDEVVAHLRRRWPDRFAALTADAGGRHPLDTAGRLVQEDLVLLVERHGELVCGAGSVCFPNRWDLWSKIGQPMAAIHAPVAQLNAQLEAPIDGFLARLRPERSYWRLGWGVLDTDELYQPTDGSAPPRPLDAPAARHHLRVERETLRRLPRTGAVLFTIRTHLTPLVDSGVTHAALAAAVEHLPADVAEYKQLQLIGPALVDWLRDHAAHVAEPRGADPRVGDPRVG